MLGISIERMFAGVPLDFTKIGLMESVAVFVVCVVGCIGGAHVGVVSRLLFGHS